MTSTAPATKGTLEFINVVKDYGTGEPAVKGITFRIEDGELVTLLGPSGAKVMYPFWRRRVRWLRAVGRSQSR